jgi:hypothetical protein
MPPPFQQADPTLLRHKRLFRCLIQPDQLIRRKEILARFAPESLAQFAPELPADLAKGLCAHQALRVFEQYIQGQKSA